jgi:NAD(P)-dependent dehydrogenase (short-subunit alcohol dehydrogenase family)
VSALLDGQRAVVTAGAGGVGLAIATELHAEGAKVFVCDVDEAALEALPEGIAGARVDVSQPREVDDWLEPLGRDGVDVLVNNAGVAGPTAPIEDIEIDAWRRCLAVGLDGQFHCTRRVVPAMKRQRSGAIVNISSTAGIMGIPNRTPYVAAKFGVIGLTKALAMELGRHGIRVNAIAPGSVEGERMERVIAAHAAAEDISEDHVRALYTLGVSMATFVDADEIAHMVVYLCSEKGRRISGQVITIDGHTETLYPRALG